MNTKAIAFAGLLMAPASLAVADTTPQAPAAPQSPVAPAEVSDSDSGESYWRFVPELSTRVTYDDNILIQPTNRERDWYLDVVPTLVYGLGSFRSEVAPYADIPHFLAQTGEEDLPRRDFAFLSYSPDGLVFAKYHKFDRVNQDARLAARQESELWVWHGQLRVQTESDPDIDTGGRLNQTYYTADAGGTYALTGMTSAEVDLDANRSDYSGGFSSTQGQAAGYLDYQIAPKTAVGAGAAAGFLNVANGANQTYAQPLLQLTYDPTAKTSFVGHAGEEFRHFDSKVGDRSRAVFDVNAGYEPSPGTELVLSATRQTISSAEYSGEDIVRSVYQGKLRQQFLEYNYLSLADGYVHDNYVNDIPTAFIARTDNYTFVNVGAARDISRNGTVELSYEHRKNDSSIPAFAFAENLESLAVSFQF